MEESFEDIKQTWMELGQGDPLWAVVSRHGTRGNKWDLREFLESGDVVVERYLNLLRTHANEALPIGHLLDFGCGVGRLALAWSNHAQRVTGVDVSEPMVLRAGDILRDKSNVSLVLNQTNDLSQFSDAMFDVVFSHICLQHMPWNIASRYLFEFGRVCRPGGVVVFQIPESRKHLPKSVAVKSAVSKCIPRIIRRVYRKWRWGSASVFEVYCTPASGVIQLLHAARLITCHKEEDSSAGPNIRSFIYVCRKPAIGNTLQMS